MAIQIEIIKEPTNDKPFLVIYKPKGLPSAPLTPVDTENALAQAAAQVLLYADDVCRKFLCPLLSRELPAITLVDAPVPLNGKDSAHCHLVEDADNSLFLPVALDGGLKDGIAILRILERDSLYGTLDLLHGRLLLTIILIRLPRLFNTIRFKAIFKETHLTVIPKW